MQTIEGGVLMNELSSAMKNERRKAVEEILAKDHNIAMWGAACQLKNHKSFSGNTTSINRYLRENFSDLFVSSKEKTDRRKKVVQQMIDERTGITMWEAASALAGHHDFTRNIHSVYQYLRNNLCALFMNTDEHGNESLAQEQYRQVRPQQKEMIVPKVSAGEVETLLGTCELLLHAPTLDAERLAAIRLLFRLVKEQYRTAVMPTPAAVTAEQVADIRASVRQEERNGFKHMRLKVVDMLDEYKITNLKGDYTHFINRMMNVYGTDDRDADEIGQMICALIHKTAGNDIPR